MIYDHRHRTTLRNSELIRSGRTTVTAFLDDHIATSFLREQLTGSSSPLKRAHTLRVDGNAFRIVATERERDPLDAVVVLTRKEKNFSGGTLQVVSQGQLDTLPTKLVSNRLFLLSSDRLTNPLLALRDLRRRLAHLGLMPELPLDPSELIPVGVLDCSGYHDELVLAVA